MEVLNIVKTKSTPEVLFDPVKQKLRIEGQSYPENAFKFYEPIMDWLDGYLQELDKQAVLEIYFHMPYINTSSSKCIMMILDKLEEAYALGKQVSIIWFYDQDNTVAIECAEEFKEDLTIPFSISPIGNGE